MSESMSNLRLHVRSLNLIKSKTKHVLEWWVLRILMMHTSSSFMPILFSRNINFSVLLFLSRNFRDSFKHSAYFISPSHLGLFVWLSSHSMLRSQISSYAIYAFNVLFSSINDINMCSSRWISCNGYTIFFSTNLWVHKYTLMWPQIWNDSAK